MSTTQATAPQKSFQRGEDRSTTKNDRERGKDVRTSNIVAAKGVADAVRTSLGPRVMDKMIVSGKDEVVITNDGATILQKLDVSHPAAKMV